MKNRSYTSIRETEKIVVKIKDCEIADKVLFVQEFAKLLYML